MTDAGKGVNNVQIVAVDQSLIKWQAGRSRRRMVQEIVREVDDGQTWTQKQFDFTGLAKRIDLKKSNILKSFSSKTKVALILTPLHTKTQNTRTRKFEKKFKADHNQIYR